MKKYNGDKIYLKIKEKIKQNFQLSDLDKLKLIFLSIIRKGK